jgi:hypothetical protein
VRLLIYLSRAPLRDVGVNLSGGRILVSQQLLHYPQVCAAVQQMCGEGAQHVRRDRPAIPAAMPALAHHSLPTAPIALDKTVSGTCESQARVPIKAARRRGGMRARGHRRLRGARSLLVPITYNAQLPGFKLTSSRAQAHQHAVRHPAAYSVSDSPNPAGREADVIRYGQQLRISAWVW